MIQARAQADLARTSWPVLLVTGSDDASTPPSRAQKIAAVVKKAKVIVLQRCGHWATVERPEEVNAEIRRFVRCKGQRPRTLPILLREMLAVPEKTTRD